MIVSRKILGLSIAACLTAGLALAAGEQGKFEHQIQARKAQMDLMAFNIGLLGGMAKGEIDYDADAAASAAGNLAAVAALDMGRAWPKGSDNASVEGTRALPAIWAADSKVGEHLTELKTTTAQLAGVAGNGLDALRGGIGPVGNACGGCHKLYRAEQK